MCAAGERAVIPATKPPGRDVRDGPWVLTLRVAARVALIAGFALAAAAVHLRRPVTLCPLRAITGVPCPFCGSTTAAVELGRGDLRGALLANPVTVLVVTAWLLGPVGTGRLWWGLASARRTVLLVGLILVAWLWQLVRFGVL